MVTFWNWGRISHRTISLDPSDQSVPGCSQRKSWVLLRKPRSVFCWLTQSTQLLLCPAPSPCNFQLQSDSTSSEWKSSSVIQHYQTEPLSVGIKTRPTTWLDPNVPNPHRGIIHEDSQPGLMTVGYPLVSSQNPETSENFENEQNHGMSHWSTGKKSGGNIIELTSWHLLCRWYNIIQDGRVLQTSNH